MRDNRKESPGKSRDIVLQKQVGAATLDVCDSKQPWNITEPHDVWYMYTWILCGQLSYDVRQETFKTAKYQAAICIASMPPNRESSQHILFFQPVETML